MSAPAGPPRPPTGRHGLGPHCIGRRVVVRRVLRGTTGPTGGPAFTDLLGVMESWADGVTTVRDESGAVTTIALSDIVSGKPVPPRPSVRLRVDAAEAERRAVEGWPPLETAQVGDWLLRAADGFSARANSVLAAGDPGMPVADALERVKAFYATRGLPAWAQVVSGSDEDRALTSAGWVPARPGEADTVFELASVARALRAARGLLPPVVPVVTRRPTVDEAWLADDVRAREHREAARRVLEGSPAVLLAGVDDERGGTGRGGGLVAKGRAASGAPGTPGADWAGITDVWVSPSHRRQGLGVVVLAGLLEWAAEQGATTAYLQVRGDNPAALALYERLGFLPHHSYRYLAHPG